MVIVGLNLRRWSILTTTTKNFRAKIVAMTSHKRDRRVLQMTRGNELVPELKNCSLPIRPVQSAQFAQNRGLLLNNVNNVIKITKFIIIMIITMLVIQVTITIPTIPLLLLIGTYSV